jgi:hypothetical protein
MKRIHRPTLKVEDISQSRYEEYGPAAKIDWKPFNQKTLDDLMERAIHQNETQRVTVLSYLKDTVPTE